MGRMIEVQSLLLAGAADALRGLDPPPVWDLIGALIKARDTRFRVEIIRVLGGLGEGYRVHVTVALAQLWQGGDPAIRRAIVEAVLTMGPASSDEPDGRQGLMG